MSERGYDGRDFNFWGKGPCQLLMKILKQEKHVYLKWRHGLLSKWMPNIASMIHIFPCLSSSRSFMHS